MCLVPSLFLLFQCSTYFILDFPMSPSSPLDQFYRFYRNWLTFFQLNSKFSQMAGAFHRRVTGRPGYKVSPSIVLYNIDIDIYVNICMYICTHNPLLLIINNTTYPNMTSSSIITDNCYRFFGRSSIV